jgi:hypothetical protein
VRGDDEDLLAIAALSLGGRRWSERRVDAAVTLRPTGS